MAEKQLLGAQLLTISIRAGGAHNSGKPSQLVTVVVQDTQRRTVSRTMRRTDELQGLMDHYYEGSGGRFVFDGRRVKGEHTPEDLNMVNGDKIDFFLDLMAG
ncbi:hypothetical protein PR202_gb21374 [Eleusine coracana subsp. coracana]|uniref:Rad60/SUMO-like domain-containing protein n=1 Tax=Eleusine coracana subsp. coracana TaxID=191504 RepID=A0AAV5FCY5_ELECO|nr:hypothetical protein PR202_gb21374 [Eleusine coracana subsp. coracana]